MNRVGVLLAALAFLVFAAGCGGDDNGTTATTSATTETQGGSADPAAVFQEFQAALADGDAGKACGLLAPTATKQTEAASIGGTCEEWVEELSGVYDDASKDKLRQTEILDTTETGDKATVKYQSPILEIPLEVELQTSGATWKLSKLSEAV